MASTLHQDQQLVKYSFVYSLGHVCNYLLSRHTVCILTALRPINANSARCTDENNNVEVRGAGSHARIRDGFDETRVKIRGVGKHLVSYKRSSRDTFALTQQVHFMSGEGGGVKPVATASAGGAKWVQCADVEDFVQSRGAELRARESLYNLTWDAIKRARRAIAEGKEGDLFFVYVHGDKGSIPSAHAALSMRMLALLVSEVSPNEASALATFLVSQGIRDLKKVEMSRESAPAFGETFKRATGKSHEVEMNQGLYEVREVQMPDLGGGKMVVAQEEHGETLREFISGFYRDALPQGQPPRKEQIDGMVQRVLLDGNAYLWKRQEDGKVVSMAWVIRNSPSTSSISLVFTPQNHRGQGYALRVVACLSQALLDAGKTACNLHTDLANATSNRVYARAGYKQIWEFSLLCFS